MKTTKATKTAAAWTLEVAICETAWSLAEGRPVTHTLTSAQLAKAAKMAAEMLRDGAAG